MVYTSGYRDRSHNVGFDKHFRSFGLIPRHNPPALFLFHLCTVEPVFRSSLLLDNHLLFWIFQCQNFSHYKFGYQLNNFSLMLFCIVELVFCWECFLWKGNSYHGPHNHLRKNTLHNSWCYGVLRRFCWLNRYSGVCVDNILTRSLEAIASHCMLLQIRSMQKLRLGWPPLIKVEPSFWNRV